MYQTELEASIILARAYNSANPKLLFNLLAPDLIWDYSHEITHGKDKFVDWFSPMTRLMKANNAPWPAEVVKARIPSEVEETKSLFGRPNRDCVLVFPGWGEPKPRLIFLSTESYFIKRIDIRDPDDYILSGKTDPPEMVFRENYPDYENLRTTNHECDAAVSYAFACNRMDPTDFITYLAPDAIYRSFLSEQPLYGNQAIAEYMMRVMQNQLNIGTTLSAQVVQVIDDAKYLLDPPEDGSHVEDGVILQQDDDQDHDRLVLFKVNDGLISYIEVQFPYSHGYCYLLRDYFPR